MPTKFIKPFNSYPGDAQKYVDELVAQFQDAQNTYNQSNSEAQKLTQEYARAQGWETLLKGYWEALEKTDRLAVDICNTLDGTIDQTDRIGCIAEYSYYAMQMMVQAAQSLSKCTEDLKHYIEDFEKHLPKLDSAEPVAKSLATLKAAVDDAFLCVQAVVLEMLKVLKSAQALYQQIGGAGLEKSMKTIRTAFKNGEDKSTYTYTSSWGECPTADRPAFPLSVSQPDYWTYFPGALEDVRECLYGTDGLRDKLEEATRERNDAKACMDALEAAIKAAKEALACKTK